MRENDPMAFDGALAIFYVALLLGSAPFVPFLWRLLESHFPRTHLVPQILAVGFFLILIRYLPRNPYRVFLFSVLTVLFFYSMILLQRPVERVHFLEYSILSFFLFRVFRHHVKNPWSYGFSVLGAFGIGILDEWLQGILPNRVYDLRDIYINLWAAGLGMAIFACLLTPNSV